MPPKRKVVKAEVDAAATSEAEPVKQKRGRKAKEEKVEEANGNVDDDIQDEVPELPKRSGRAKKTVPEYNETATKEAKANKPKRGKKKAAKKEESPVPEEVAEPEEADELSEEEPKPVKKTKKGAAEKSTKKTKKVAADSSEADVPSKKSKKPAAEANGDSKSAEKKSKRGAKSKKNVEEENEDEEPPVKKTKVLLNKTATNWESIDFACTKKNKYDVSYNLIVSTWNIGGVKSWVSKGCMEYLNHESPDIFCVQETKCNESKLPEEIKNLKLYKQYWCSSKKEGYAGVGIFSVREPKSVTYGIEDDEQDEDGRCITAEYEKFYLVNVYVPNAGRKLVTLDKRLRWNDSFKKYILKLDEKKPVIICGDMNVSHQEIDLARPKNNTKNAGFTPQERDGMTDFLKAGFIDLYRYIYPEEKDVYSFWTYMANARSKNIGWRLDYFLVSEKLMKGVCDVKYRTKVLGSDHCPVTLFINA